jgi:hypothetical protein
MTDSLPPLEIRRSQILRQIGSLGDLRPGSICTVTRRCGKPTCHCAKPNDPGHDPQLRLTRKVDGKTWRNWPKASYRMTIKSGS